MVTSYFHVMTLCVQMRAELSGALEEKHGVYQIILASVYIGQ